MPVSLTDEQKATILSLVREFREQNSSAREEEVKQIERNRRFYRGDQNVYWDGKAKKWTGVTGTAGVVTGGDVPESSQRYSLVTNIFRRETLTTVALLGVSATKLRFAPQKASQIEDVNAAKAATDVSQLIESNNHIEKLRVEQALHMCLDGGCAAYVRYVADPIKYGTIQEPIIQEKPGMLTPDAMSCPACGAPQELGADWLQTGEMPDVCAACGQQLSPGDVQPGQAGQVPQVVGFNEIAKGEEVITLVPYLEFERPYSMNDFKDVPWVAWSTEVFKARLRAAYPDAWDKLGTDQGGQEGAGVSARDARLAVKSSRTDASGGPGDDELLTFDRVWLKSWAFGELDDQKKAQELTALFPDGGAFAIVGDQLLDAENEDLHKKWSVLPALPGHGQIRDSIMTDMIDVQRRYNLEENIMSETFERGLSVRFIDTEAINKEAYQSKGSLPGSEVFVVGKPGQGIRDFFYDSPPAAVSSQLPQHMQWLSGETSHGMTGNFPAAFGGDTGQNETKGGITIARDQALGRLAPFILAMRQFWADTVMNAIDCFKENRKEDVEMSVLGGDGQFEPKMIYLDSLRGGFHVVPLADEAIPSSWSDRKAIGQQMLQHPNPQVANALLYPPNIENLKQIIGDDDIVVPGINEFQKQIAEIKLLLEGQAMQGPPTIDPMSGMMVPGPMMPSVPIDEVMDDHETEAAAGRYWASTPDGMKARLENPLGYANVVAHIAAHNMTVRMAQQAMAPPAPGGEGPPA